MIEEVGGHEAVPKRHYVGLSCLRMEGGGVRDCFVNQYARGGCSANLLDALISGNRKSFAGCDKAAKNNSTTALGQEAGIQGRVQRLTCGERCRHRQEQLASRNWGEPMRQL